MSNPVYNDPFLIPKCRFYAIKEYLKKYREWKNAHENEIIPYVDPLDDKSILYNTKSDIIRLLEEVAREIDFRNASDIMDILSNSYSFEYAAAHYANENFFITKAEFRNMVQAYYYILNKKLENTRRPEYFEVILKTAEKIKAELSRKEEP